MMMVSVEMSTAVPPDAGANACAVNCNVGSLWPLLDEAPGTTCKMPELIRTSKTAVGRLLSCVCSVSLR